MLIVGCSVGPGFSASFKIVSYNVENLFDLNPDGTEYPDYVPGGPLGWDSTQLDIKLGNISLVIKDLDADIIALQEVESENALALLQKRLSLVGLEYPFSAIANGRLTSVKCAVLSRFSITEKNEICSGNENERNILKVQLDIKGNPLVLYVNHWKSKAGPESKRLKYARALAGDISKMSCDADYMLIGDFNSDYNEYKTFKHIPRFNDTHGITGINHIVHTVNGQEMVGESFLTKQEDCEYVYNLWLEIPEYRRWSVNFFGRKNSPDSIIVSKGLYDSKGVSYLDNSFDKFDPDYLFDNNKVFRWQRAERGRGRHLGKGYSDHLPIFAEFSTEPFSFESLQKLVILEPNELSIAGLYDLKKGTVNIRINDAVVIFKEGNNAVIKEKDGRAIYVYQGAKELQHGKAYGLTVTQLNRHYGNMEITGIKDLDPLNRETDLNAYLIKDPASGFDDPDLQNEVIERIDGVYENGWFHYEADQKIKLYFTNPALKPEDFSIISLFHVRIGYHRHPEIIVERADQILKQ
ncbi:MAG: endonuclease/exonuclease/phosphatase family protein [Desulfobacteraceae bacterium]|nr:endonuclease/exonuclease/phosphatase family protein [Desulfobacteraceae bacterium]